MKDIEEYYKTFGNDCIRVIRAQIEEHGNLMPLLERLGLPTLPGLENQHDALQAFIYRYGISLFLKVAKVDVDSATAERIKLERLMLQSRARGGVKRGSSGLAKPKATAAEQEMQRRLDMLTAEISRLAGKPVPGLDPSLKPQEQPQTASPEHEICTPTYKGANRRKRKERRTVAGDRRTKVVAIAFKNRRFGGVRRKLLRRRDDRERLLPEHLQRNLKPAAQAPAALPGAPAVSGGFRPLAASAPVLSEQSASADPSTSKVIQTATYTGPDRRTGKDRRSGRDDRRDRSAVIFFKNRRYGGDRRRSPGRRATDRRK